MPLEEPHEGHKPPVEMNRLIEEHYSQLRARIRSILQTRNREVIDDFLSELVIRLLEKQRTFDSTRRFLPWARKIAKNLSSERFRKRVAAALYYDLSADSLVRIGNTLLRKDDDVFPVLLVQPTLDALQPLVGRRFNREKLLADLRQCLLNRNGGPLCERTLRRATDVIAQETHVAGIEEHTTPHEIPEGPRPTSELDDSSRIQCLCCWLESEELADPQSAAVYFLKHYDDGLDSSHFDQLRMRLQKRFPGMQILDNVPTQTITWHEISQIVYGEESSPSKSRNTYDRKSTVHWAEWQQTFCKPA